MPSSVVLFRGLLIASVLTGLLSGFVDQIFTDLIPASLSKPYEDLPEPGAGALTVIGALVFISFGGIVAAIIGLYLFKPWARGLALWMTILQLAFYPLLGVTLQSGWAQMLLDLSSTLWGAVLAMSYVSSLAAHFEATAP